MTVLVYVGRALVAVAATTVVITRDRARQAVVLSAYGLTDAAAAALSPWPGLREGDRSRTVATWWQVERR